MKTGVSLSIAGSHNILNLQGLNPVLWAERLENVSFILFSGGFDFMLRYI